MWGQQNTEQNRTKMLESHLDQRFQDILRYIVKRILSCSNIENIGCVILKYENLARQFLI